VNVDDETHLDGIMEIMRRPEDSYDIDSLDEEYREAEYVPAASATGAGMGAADADRGVMGTTEGMEPKSEDEVIPMAEERLRVGKRDVGRGSVHVRAYTREVPVEERVTLHSEEVHVERRPASGTVTAEDAFQEREVVMEERDEEAVVTKEAEVTEEVVVSKDTEVREEVVTDTVRKTEVEVDGDKQR
jgi:uncharacterized protein (TIGR02271 family)